MAMKITKQIKEIRRKNAQERQTAYDKLSTKEKLEVLDRKFGNGNGAKKVRARLMKAAEKPEDKKPEEKKSQ